MQTLAHADISTNTRRYLQIRVNSQLADEVFVIDEVLLRVSECCQHLIHLLLSEGLTWFKDKQQQFLCLHMFFCGRTRNVRHTKKTSV